jgi:selenocysteine lyase/cysteine desulfurase
MSFVGGDEKRDVVIFVKNATEAINKVAYRLTQEAGESVKNRPHKNNGKEKKVILSTFMEHHSNDLPWRDKYEVEYIEVDECGRLIFDDLLTKLEKYKGLVKLVAVTRRVQCDRLCQSNPPYCRMVA